MYTCCWRRVFVKWTHSVRGKKKYNKCYYLVWIAIIGCTRAYTLVFLKWQESYFKCGIDPAALYRLKSFLEQQEYIEECGRGVQTILGATKLVWDTVVRLLSWHKSIEYFKGTRESPRTIPFMVFAIHTYLLVFWFKRAIQTSSLFPHAIAMSKKINVHAKEPRATIRQ